MNISHIKLQIKKRERKKKEEYTGTLLSSLSKADFARFQHKIFSKLIIINTALFVLFLLFNSPQIYILTRSERHLEELKDTLFLCPFGTKTGSINSRNLVN